MYKLLSIILLCLSVLSMSTAHADNNFANPDPNTNPNIDPKDWRKTPGALRPAPDKIIPFPKPNKPQKVHVPFDVKKIGKYLGKGGAALLPALAYELIGVGVDYVLDPDNNRVILPSGNHSYKCDASGNSGSSGKYLHDDNSAARLYCSNRNTTYIKHFTQYPNSPDLMPTRYYVQCDGESGDIHCRKLATRTEIPLDELATRLIEAARRGNPDAKRLLESWADDEVNTNPDPYRRQLESTDPKVNPNIDPNSETNPEDNPSADVCQTGYTKDKDGVCVPEKQETEDEEESPEEEGEESSEEESNPDDGKLDIDSTPIPLDKVNISFEGACPPDSTFPFSIAGRRLSFSISYHYICKIAVSVGGIVKILSTIVAMYILAGIKS